MLPKLLKVNKMQTQNFRHASPSVDFVTPKQRLLRLRIVSVAYVISPNIVVQSNSRWSLTIRL